MQTKDNNIKTTCNKIYSVSIRPEPAKVVAEIVGCSEDYVKAVRTGKRSDNSNIAKAIKYCDELIIGGKEVLLTAVADTVAKISNPQ